MSDDLTSKPIDEKSVADLEGPWLDPNFESDLIQRCRRYWDVPISQLPDNMLATFLHQDFALTAIIAEAQRRQNAGIKDDSELYDGQLADALREKMRQKGSSD